MKINDKLDIKIFILYLLENVGQPLEFTTINDIVLQDEFVGYFDFAFCFSELLESGQVEELRVDGKTMYGISSVGSESLASYENSLLPIIKERALRSAIRLIAYNHGGDRVQSSITEEAGGYRLKCGIGNKEKSRFSVELFLTEREHAERMREYFDERAEVIFRGVISLMSGDVGFLFEE